MEKDGGSYILGYLVGPEQHHNHLIKIIINDIPGDHFDQK